MLKVRAPAAASCQFTSAEPCFAVPHCHLNPDWRYLLFVGVCDEVHGFRVRGYLKGVRLVDDVLRALDGQALLHLDHAPRDRVLRAIHR